MDKIVATLGYGREKTDDGFEKILLHIIENGVNNFRINLKSFSKKDKERCEKMLGILSKHYSDDIKCKVFIDIPYPRKKIRLSVSNGKLMKINCGDRVIIVQDSERFPIGESTIISSDFFGEKIQIGNLYYYADGDGRLECIEILYGKRMVFKALDNFTIRDNKSISMLSTKKNEIESWQIEFLNKLNKNSMVNAFLLSFCESKVHIKTLSRIFCERSTKIYAKIETQLGVENCNEILNVCDGIVLARGDLALYSDISNFYNNQKNISNATKKADKDLLIATDILSSLETRYVPARSEIIDYHVINELSPNYVILNAPLAYHKRYQVIENFISTMDRNQ